MLWKEMSYNKLNLSFREKMEVEPDYWDNMLNDYNYGNYGKLTNNQEDGNN